MILKIIFLYSRKWISFSSTQVICFASKYHILTLILACRRFMLHTFEFEESERIKWVLVFCVVFFVEWHTNTRNFYIDREAHNWCDGNLFVRLLHYSFTRISRRCFDDDIQSSVLFFLYVTSTGQLELLLLLLSVVVLLSCVCGNYAVAIQNNDHRLHIYIIFLIRSINIYCVKIFSSKSRSAKHTHKFAMLPFCTCSHSTVERDYVWMYCVLFVCIRCL